MLSGWHAVLWWGLWQCHCRQMLCGLGKVKETTACSHLQALVSYGAWQGIHGLYPLGYAPWCKTWGPNILDLKWLFRHDLTMIGWICGTNDRVETSSVSLPHKIGIRILQQAFTVGGWDSMDMYSVPRHVSNLSQTFCFLVPEGKKGLRKTWSECVKTAFSDFGLTGVDHKTDAWRCLESQCLT